MTIDALRTWITLLVILGNVIVLLVAMTLWLMGGFTGGEFKQIVLMLTPLLFAYGTTVFKYILNDQSERTVQPLIKRTTGLLSIGTLFLVQVMVITLAILKSYNVIKTFEDFSIALGATQTILGTYIGLIISEFFKAEIRSTTAKKSLPKGSQ